MNPDSNQAKVRQIFDAAVGDAGQNFLASESGKACLESIQAGDFAKALLAAFADGVAFGAELASRVIQVVPPEEAPEEIGPD